MLSVYSDDNSLRSFHIAWRENHRAGIGPQSWRAIASSANCALEAADAVRGGAFESYALCRPPGHHAYADLAGGYCRLCL
jgi:acetoin utilization deacetylase AcuC-like enzyme